MRILSTVSRAFPGHPATIQPMFLEFTLPLKRMGHRVDHFDHAELCHDVGPDACGERFVQKVRAGGYDLVLYQTGAQDLLAHEAIKTAGRLAPIVAWNSDDDGQWHRYTSKIAPLFTYMVTTCPQVFGRAVPFHRNLLLNQWGCLEGYAESSRPRDLDFTFAGHVDTNRLEQCRHLHRTAGMQVFGPGAIRVKYPMPGSKLAYRLLAPKSSRLDQALSHGEIFAIWNRSRVSYIPAGTTSPAMQIKSRAFQMGLSGTMMLCQHSPYLAPYYEPGKEFVAFDDLDDCAEKARFFVSHENARRRIAEAYMQRTRAEHLWEHRFAQLFRDIGLTPRLRKAA